MCFIEGTFDYLTVPRDPSSSITTPHAQFDFNRTQISTVDNLHIENSYIFFLVISCDS